MNQSEYYIGTGATRKGPYDLIMLMRKIRNGSLAEDMMVHLGNEAEAQPAIRWVELSDFFKEKFAPPEEQHANKEKMATIALGAALRNGWYFLQEHTVSTILSATVILLAVALVAVTYLFVPPVLQIPVIITVFLLSFTMLSCYMLPILRMTRGLPLDMDILLNRISLYFNKLLYAAILVATPAAIGVGLMTWSYSTLTSIAGLVFLIIPGLLWITLHVFVPLLIMDRDMSVREAMHTSRKALLQSGMENVGSVYALYAINFVAGLLTLLPMVISLPMTMSAITQAYDNHFS